MKKIIALVLAAMMLLACCSALAEAPEGYPEIIEGLDFGGADVYIYDWWSGDTRVDDPDEETQLRYDYIDWLQETYNCTIHETALSDWEGNPQELANRVMNKDNSELAIIAVAGGFAGKALANDLYMPWTYGLDGDLYLQSVSDFMTKDGVVYGVSAGSIEPRQGVFFNKKVLEDANIDWNELYDLQANNEWTWDKFEEYMDKVQVDKDGDGVYDVYALTGNGDDVFIGLVVSNNADFYGYNEEGKLVPTIQTDEMYEAIDRRAEWGSKYMEPNEAWDDYKSFWPQGNVAFIIGQSYEGFNGNDLVNEIDEWGFVAMPVGPHGTTYTSAAENNVYGIPNVYDEETSLKLQQLYTLYRLDTPGVEQDEYSWATSYYGLTDDRAIEETYAMLREGEHATIMKFNLLGGRNDVCTEVMWSIGSDTAAAICEAAMPAFQGRCDVFNGDITQEELDAQNAAAEEAAAE